MIGAALGAHVADVALRLEPDVARRVADHEPAEAAVADEDVGAESEDEVRERRARGRR